MPENNYAACWAYSGSLGSSVSEPLDTGATHYPLPEAAGASSGKAIRKAQIKSELIAARREAQEDDELPLTDAAERACLRLIEVVVDSLIWFTGLTAHASATNEGGAIVIIDRPKRYRLSIEVSADGAAVTVARIDAEAGVERAVLESPESSLKTHLDWIASCA